MNEIDAIKKGVKFTGENICPVCFKEKHPSEPKCANCLAQTIEKNRQAFIALQENQEPKKGEEN